MNEYISYLPHINACLNGTSAVLLLSGLLVYQVEECGGSSDVPGERAGCFGILSSFRISRIAFILALHGFRGLVWRVRSTSLS